jgi:hypothetical protein
MLFLLYEVCDSGRTYVTPQRGIRKTIDISWLQRKTDAENVTHW